jgi:uncharacterized membrane protein HdeD (DUF308 family)
MNTKHDLWWLWILRSAATATFAMIAVAFPPLTSSLAVYLYGGYIKLDGFLLIGLNTSSDVKRPWLLVAGVIAVGSGVAILLAPPSATHALLYVLAVLAIGRGVLEAKHAICDEQHIRNCALRIISGSMIAVYGLALAAHEALGLRSLIDAFALQALLTSACQFAVGVEQWSKHMHETPPRDHAPYRGQTV